MDSNSLLIDVLSDDELENAFLSQGIETYSIRREGLDGATTITVIATIAAAVIPTILDILRSRVSKRRVFAVEWNGIRFENVSEEKLYELIEMINQDLSQGK